VDDLGVAPGVMIPAREIKFRFARSGGPGGQNVNKVESRVELLFNVLASVAFTETQRHRLQAALHKRLDDDGVLQIVVQDSRSQWQNRELALARLADTIRAGLTPRKKRVATRPSRGSKEERVKAKKIRGNIKKNRGRVSE
jgi:ribosome-associated protein